MLRGSAGVPVFLDVEGSGGRADGLNSATRTKVIKAFCETIENSGYTAGIYANKSWFEKKMDVTQLTKYKIWLAQYASTPSYTKSKIDIWQYKSTGKVSGISGNVDLNISYLGY
jgi:GH25 family lysozyme M1 (1,4-beta-N-acetylmuramidase)